MEEPTATMIAPTLELHVTVSPSPSPLKFPSPRSNAHRLHFSNLTETEQAIYAFDYESKSLVKLFTFPPEMSLHRQPEAFFTDKDGNQIPTSLPVGLTRRWMFLSPDGRTLATLQPAFGGHPNYLHQIDLMTGEVATIKLLEDYKWTIPTVPGREPDPRSLVLPGGEAQADVSSVFENLVWAPDSSGFVFTIGNIAGGVNGLYCVPNGSGAVVPPAANAPGNDIGQRAAWSPDARLLAYARNPTREGIWLIDIHRPDTATQLTELPTPNVQVWAMKWSLDGKSIFIQAAGQGGASKDFAPHLLPPPIPSSLWRTETPAWERSWASRMAKSSAGQTTPCAWVEIGLPMGIFWEVSPGETLR